MPASKRSCENVDGLAPPPPAKRLRPACSSEDEKLRAFILLKKKSKGKANPSSVRLYLRDHAKPTRANPRLGTPRAATVTEFATATLMAECGADMARVGDAAALLAPSRAGGKLPDAVSAAIKLGVTEATRCGSCWWLWRPPDRVGWFRLAAAVARGGSVALAQSAIRKLQTMELGLRLSGRQAVSRRAVFAARPEPGPPGKKPRMGKPLLDVDKFETTCRMGAETVAMVREDLRVQMMLQCQQGRVDIWDDGRSKKVWCLPSCVSLSQWHDR